MTRCSSCSRKSYCLLISLGKILQPILLLAIRLFWGYLFFKSGISKLGNISETGQFFSSLSIPLPYLSAYLVGLIEMAGGILLMIGLGTRLAAIPLIVIMAVAYLTAHADVASQIITNPQAFVQESAFNHLLACLILLAFGPGLISIDALIKRFWCRPPRTGYTPGFKENDIHKDKDAAI